ncbi:PilZ domain-containing protein [Emcibacter nanhaiensis]|uniref:PilZ domain-containing protein n=1 Tax=Emcibacter nanhaiensis TaxID=1505037 RepID=A0A501PBM4_9PROT|nr:PilZ domain-containing protein [Emcibacter nanhaiensis]TPD57635.1 PilZ domain-containing protein [Emcibacter nanhaiensis]
MSGAVADMDALRVEKIKEGLNCMRMFKRRTVVWPSTLFVGPYEFKSTLYDISLGGVRMKLDLPLARGAYVKVRIKELQKMDAQVVWHSSGFIGFKFVDDPETVRELLGELAVGMD